jgi:glyoxylase-like metal-dependent hydrolase (beta-lactamase superfamily II)
MFQVFAVHVPGHLSAMPSVRSSGCLFGGDGFGPEGALTFFL